MLQKFTTTKPSRWKKKAQNCSVRCYFLCSWLPPT